MKFLTGLAVFFFTVGSGQPQGEGGLSQSAKDLVSSGETEWSNVEFLLRNTTIVSGRLWAEEMRNSELTIDDQKKKIIVSRIDITEVIYADLGLPLQYQRLMVLYESKPELGPSYKEDVPVFWDAKFNVEPKELENCNLFVLQYCPGWPGYYKIDWPMQRAIGKNFIGMVRQKLKLESERLIQLNENIKLFETRKLSPYQGRIFEKLDEDVTIEFPAHEEAEKLRAKKLKK